ncbi:MAG: FMN-binding protein [Candidatus Omnitrophota bacterium]
MKKSLLSLFFALGFLSLLSQTLIVREFIIAFGGNELGIGLFYFFWLFWVGLGAFLALRLLDKFPAKHFLKLLALYPVLSLFQLVLFINLRKTAQIAWWEIFSPEKAVFYLFFFTSFISLFTGMIFTIGAVWLKKQSPRSPADIITYSYIVEGMGSFISGCIVTFLIIKLQPPAVILITGCCIFSLISVFVSGIFKDKAAQFLNISVFAAFAVLAFDAQGLDTFLKGIRARNVFPEAEQINEIYTPYQHLFLGTLGTKKVVLSNGQMLITMPEEIDADKEAGLLISQSELPKRILIIGCGAENLLKSLIKYPLDSITYCVSDRIYYREVQKNMPESLRQALSDQRLRVIFKPPRIFLKENLESRRISDKFDIAVVYTGDPENLVINSFFTKEFYLLLSGNLSSRGLISTRITSAENFIGQEIRNYGSSLYYTLKEVFPKMAIVGSKTNWFFAGGKDSSLTDNPEILKKRLDSIIPASSTFNTQALSSIFEKNRIEFVTGMYKDNPLFEKKKMINSDSRPLSFFLSLLVLCRHSNSYLVTFFKAAFFSGIILFFLPAAAFLTARIWFLLRVENSRDKRLLFNSKLFQFLSGFMGFSFHLVLIFLFQNKFGTIFAALGMVNAIFMLGLCLGGVGGRILLKKTGAEKAVLFVLAFQAVLFSAAYPLFVKFDLPQILYYLLFTIFFLVSGIITGSSYPLSAKMMEGQRGSFGRVASNLELFDHFGGALAGLLTGCFLLPIAGLSGALLCLIFIVFAVGLLFAGEISFRFFLETKKFYQSVSFPYVRTSFVLFTLCSALLINSSILEKNKKFLERESTKKQMLEECSYRQKPFPLTICDTPQGKEYTIESKHIASQIHGFGGEINLKITFDSEGKIKQIKALEHNETSCYVADMNAYLAQFKGKSLLKGGLEKNIDAISGATITSQAVIEITNKTGSALEAILNEQPGSKEGFKSTAYNINFINLTPSIFLIVFTFLAVMLYIFPHPKVVRKIYLILIVFMSGVVFNTVFSSFNLGRLLTGIFPKTSISIPFLLLFLPVSLSIFLGNLWCGWLCPYGALQELFNIKKTNNQISSSISVKARYFKYILLSFFLIGVVFTNNPSFFGHEPLLVFFKDTVNFSVIKILSLVALIFSLFFLRFWCRYFCVCGAFLSLFNKLTLLKRFFPKYYRHCPLGVKASHDLDCIHCNLCLYNH